MSKADDNEALQLRDAAVTIATTKGKQLVPGGPFVFVEPVLSISYQAGSPCVLSIHKWGFDEGPQVLNVVWRDGGDEVVTVFHGGSWADRLRRLAGIG